MQSVRFVYWQEGDWWLGFLQEYPGYQTQGESLEGLQESLRDLYRELSSGAIPSARRVGELQIA